MNKVNKLTLTDSNFPSLLSEIPDPPKQIYVKGNIAALQTKLSIGIIGSRKASHYGRGVTNSLVQHLAPYDISVVSGLALGIDSIAHKAALESRVPAIAVLPCGVETIYPSSHASLAHAILNNGGALVSEFEGSVRPMKYHFIQRNRIISGLSTALLVIEATEKSGTLHTVRFALEQGRSVLAVPGNITQPSSAGTNNLIAQGARIVTSYQDVLDELNVRDSHRTEVEVFGANEEETRILQLIQGGCNDGQLLLENSQLESHIFQQAMTMLEISGKIQPLGANQWTLR